VQLRVNTYLTEKTLANIIFSILLASVRYAVAFPLAVLQFHFSFMETIIYLNFGGALGVFFFAYLSGYINRWWNRVHRKRRIKQVQNVHDKGTGTSKKKKVFTKRNRRIIYIKQRYGLAGISIATPILLSIPVGAFLVVRYYRSKPFRLLWLLAANLGWSLIYTTFYTFFYHLIR